ncbi:MAG: hypothetical protein IT376_08810 [Polyangiaceae bacterium]|nr:hypothetical protein [Polyangiaceae bacterium]
MRPQRLPGYLPRALARLPVIAVVGLLVAACKPGAGSSCDRGDGRCLDAQRMLKCQGGRLVEMPCKGKGGCALGPKGPDCDLSGNADGDPCSTDDEGIAACADDKTLVACRSGKFVRAACKGPDGCVQQGANAVCDATRADVGDACKDPSHKACAADGSAFLACSEGKLARVFDCRGKNGCKATGSKLDCDMTVARIDDPCPKEMEGRPACSDDGAHILECQRGVFAIETPCTGGKRCSADGAAIRCDQPSAR